MCTRLKSGDEINWRFKKAIVWNYGFVQEEPNGLLLLCRWKSPTATGMLVLESDIEWRFR